MNKRYPITFYIIGITVVCYLLQYISKTLFGIDILIQLGMKNNALIMRGQIWRFITPILLHGSILHIGFNMYALYTIGPGLERRYGVNSFISLYLISGLWGNVLSFLLSPYNSLGASTAIFGLIAAQGVYVYKNRFLLGQAARPLLINILMVIAINLMLGLSPDIDNWGHLGGLLGGLLYAWFAGPTFGIESTITMGRIIIRQPKNPRMVSLALVLLAALLILVGFLFYR